MATGSTPPSADTNQIASFFSKAKADRSVPGLPTNWPQHLSNFTRIPGGLLWQDELFPTVEHAFQAAKWRYCAQFTPEQAATVCAIYTEFTEPSPLTPAEAKRRGGKTYMAQQHIHLKGEKWNEAAPKIMAQILRARYRADALFRHILAQTHRHQIYLLHFERSGAKSVWGGCLKNREIHGQNLLGHLLMKLRAAPPSEKVAHKRTGTEAAVAAPVTKQRRLAV